MTLNGLFQSRSRDWAGFHNNFNDMLDRISKTAGGINVYNIRVFRDYNTDMIKNFFRSELGLRLFKFNPAIVFDATKPLVQKGLFNDFMRGYSPRVDFCLLKNLPVLVYTGQNDLICNTPGNMRWLDRVEFTEQ